MSTSQRRYLISIMARRYRAPIERGKDEQLRPESGLYLAIEALPREGGY